MIKSIQSNLYNFIIILFGLLSTTTFFAQDKFEVINNLTVGKLLFNKNIKIINDTLTLSINVNNKGYCFSTDVVMKMNENEKREDYLDKKVTAERNDSILNEKLSYCEFSSFSDHFSYRGKTHRYDNYFGVIRKEGIDKIYLGNDVEVGIYTETNNYDKLNSDSSALCEASGSLLFNTLDEVISFLQSTEVVQKQTELVNAEKEKEEALIKIKATPIQTIQLPYKLIFNWTEIEIENHLKKTFGEYSKKTNEFPSFEEKKGIIKCMEYHLSDNPTSFLTIYVKFYKGKSYEYGYSHTDNNAFNIETLNTKVSDKIDALTEEYEGLLSSNFNDSDYKDIYSISIDDIVKTVRDSINQKVDNDKKNETKRKNNIGNKM